MNQANAAYQLQQTHSMMPESSGQERNHPVRRISRRQETLCSSRQFRSVYEQGRKFSTPYFSAFLLRNNDSGQRMGVTVTRKIGKAVIRNRCKRRLREVFRLRDRSVLRSVGFDLVINVRSQMVTADYGQIKAAFENMLERFSEVVARSAGTDRSLSGRQ